MTIVNQDPYLRTDRSFPQDVENLSDEVDKAYIDLANAVNSRTIGVYSKNRPSVTGDQWFLTPEKKQTLRQIYTPTSTLSIPHGINLRRINYRISSMSGTFTDGTNVYSFLAGTNVAVAGLISFYLDPTDIVFLTGAGAPSITDGLIVIEWLSEI